MFKVYVHRAGNRELLLCINVCLSFECLMISLHFVISGSDDAIGPHFPSQYLGSRTDGPPSTGGIYGTRNPEKKDALSTIDEKSVAVSMLWLNRSFSFLTVSEINLIK